MKLFISHASEDKESIVRELVYKLKLNGFDVWFDEHSLTLGDSLRQEIEKGLIECEFGVVILSNNFFNKHWARKELDSLTSKEIIEERKIIIPIWHGVDVKTVAKYSLNLADKLGISSDKGVDNIVHEIIRAIGFKQFTTNHEKREKLIVPEGTQLVAGFIMREIWDYFIDLSDAEKIKFLHDTADLNNNNLDISKIAYNISILFGLYTSSNAFYNAEITALADKLHKRGLALQNTGGLLSN